MDGREQLGSPGVEHRRARARQGRTDRVRGSARARRGKTVAGVVDTIHPLLGGLVDELIVLDSGSSDATAERAAAAGATVISREDAVPGLPPVAGKGEVAVALDCREHRRPDRLRRLRPRGTGPRVRPKLLVRCSRSTASTGQGLLPRPLRVSGTEDANGGGRCHRTGRPTHAGGAAPRTPCVLQPLGGEYAGTRELLSSVPFAPGYGVEIGLLLDTYDRLGLGAIGQVNLGCASTATGRCPNSG